MHPEGGGDLLEVETVILLATHPVDRTAPAGAAAFSTQSDPLTVANYTAVIGIGT